MWLWSALRRMVRRILMLDATRVVFTVKGEIVETIRYKAGDPAILVDALLKKEDGGIDTSYDATAWGFEANGTLMSADHSSSLELQGEAGKEIVAKLSFLAPSAKDELGEYIASVVKVSADSLQGEGIKPINGAFAVIVEDADATHIDFAFRPVE